MSATRRFRSWYRLAVAGAGLAASMLAARGSASAQQAGHGWTPLFDGRSTDGWKGAARIAVEDGTLVLAGGPDAVLCTEREYRDFVLRFRARPSTDDSRAEALVRARVPAAGGRASGMAAPIARSRMGMLRDAGGHIVVAADRAALGRVADTAQWLDHAIYANGGQVRLFVNGQLLSDHIDRGGGVPPSGAVCLRAGPGNDTLRVREVELRELTPRPAGPLAEPARTVAFRKRVVHGGFVSEGVAVGDVDRDGDVDVIAGAYWFEAPTWSRHALRAPKEFSVHRGYSDSFLNFALDVDRDGWLDVVQFDFPGRAAYWYRNPGRRDSSWTRRVVHPAVASESPQMVDVDGDGRDDLLFVDAAVRQMVWMQAPTRQGDTLWTRHVVGAPLPPSRGRAMPHGLGFADVDGDGRADVLSIDAWWHAPAKPDTTWEEHLADLGAPAAHMYAYDVDGDGDRDVVASSAHDFGLWWYEQSRDASGETRWTRHTIDDRVSVMHALAATDVDGDGTMDLVSGKRFLAHNGNDPGEYDPSVLLWYRGGRDAAGRPTWTPYLIDGDAGIGLQIVIADVTGDGRADIVTSSKKGVFVFERVR